MRRPVIAYIANTLNPGGTERLVVNMGLAFATEFDLHVFCLDEPGLWASRLRDEGIPVHGLWRQPGIDLSVPSRLAQHLRAIDADIIHAHQCTPWFYAALSRYLFRKPKLLLEEHGRFWPEPDSLKRRLINRLIINPMTHRVVAVSQDIGRRLTRYEGIDSTQIEIIYNGVSPAAHPDIADVTQLRNALGLGPKDFVIGTVGRLDPIKNLPMLITALCKASVEFGSIRGLIIGDGPERVNLARMIADRGLSQRIVLTGHRDDARELLPCMDLFVLASYSEGTSVALLEAMSAGVPAAVTAVGGNPEIVMNGQTGWVIPSGDAEALADVFMHAVNDPENARLLGSMGRTRFESNFSFSAMIDAYRKLYLRMMHVSTDSSTSQPTGTA